MSKNVRDWSSMDNVDQEPELTDGDSWITPEEAVDKLGGRIREVYLLNLFKKNDYPIYKGKVKNSNIVYIKSLMEQATLGAQ